MPVLEALVTNPELAQFYTRLLRQMRGSGAQANIDAAISADIGPLATSSFNPGDANNLAWYYGGTNSRRILLIDGVRNSNQAAALIAGYSTPLGIPVVVGNNTWIEAQARRIAEALGTDSLSRQEHLDFAGYSAGGAAALIIMAQMLFFEFRPKMKASTFGSPRSGQAALRDRLAGSSIARWMTDADPIPLVPLRLQDAPVIAALVSIPVLLNWSNYVHTQGGISINANNTTTPATLPPLAVANPISSVAGWYFGVEEDPNNPHALNTYDTRLAAIVASEAQPATVAVEDAPREHSTGTNRREVNQERERVEHAIFTTAANQTENPIITPEATLFKAYRSGRTWYVGFGEATVITAGPEKRARHIARAGNDFLRSLQKQAVVDPDTLLEQMNLFLQLAQDPATGFRPTINTTPPT